MVAEASNLNFVLGLLLLLVMGLALRSRSASSQTRLSTAAGSLVQVAVGLGVLALVTYVVAYFLSLVGGFYESLTCKVVTLPACEDPLALPAWLRLPQQSVGGVIGILPLLGIYLAKVLQPRAAPWQPPQGERWYASLGHQTVHWFQNNAGVVFVLVIELWLAFLRGSAEAADRQVRIALGLDQALPAIYLSVAQWGAVVLALGLSVVVIYLGIVGRYSRLLLVGALARLEYGAGLVTLLGGLVQLLAEGLRNVWKLVAIAVGRLALKLQKLFVGLWAAVAVALGRTALKTQHFLLRAWAFFATTLGWTVLALARLFRAGGRNTFVVVAALALGGSSVSYATTYAVLFDATGSEQGRLTATAQKVLSWADPSPQRALLKRGDRLIVIPIRAPGNLDPTYSALFNATYPSNQLDRYAFFTELRDALPTTVDSDPGTGLSDSLRAAARYLADATDDRVLIVFGNGEDHAVPVTPAELSGLEGATVIHLNLGLDTRDKWAALYSAAGASKLLLYDLAATTSLRESELKEALGLN